MRRARLRFDARATDKIILDIIKQHKDKQRPEQKFTLHDIAEKAGCHLNTASTSVKRLQAAGMVKKTNHGRNGLSYEVTEA